MDAAIAGVLGSCVIGGVVVSVVVVLNRRLRREVDRKLARMWTRVEAATHIQAIYERVVRGRPRNLMPVVAPAAPATAMRGHRYTVAATATGAALLGFAGVIALDPPDDVGRRGGQSGVGPTQPSPAERWELVPDDGDARADDRASQTRGTSPVVDHDPSNELASPAETAETAPESDSTVSVPHERPDDAEPPPQDATSEPVRSVSPPPEPTTTTTTQPAQPVEDPVDEPGTGSDPCLLDVDPGLEGEVESQLCPD